MKVTIEFDCDNAAFEDDFHGEIRNILDRVERKVKDVHSAQNLAGPDSRFEATYKLLDTNGNAVGKMWVVP